MQITKCLAACWALIRALVFTIISCLKLFRLNDDAKLAKRRLIIDWCHQLMKIFECQWLVEWRTSALPTNEPLVVMSNHASHLDIPFLFMAFDPVPLTMVAKKELFQIPIFGRAMYSSQMAISVNREDHRAAMGTMQEAANLVKSGKLVWIAPEGHRSTTGALGRFKRGGFWLAKHSGAKIVPVTIIGSGKVLPAKRWLPNLKQRVKIIIGPLVDTAQASEKQLMEEVAAIMQHNLEL